MQGLPYTSQTLPAHGVLRPALPSAPPLIPTPITLHKDQTSNASRRVEDRGPGIGHVNRVQPTVFPSAHPTRCRPHRRYDPRSTTTAAPSRRLAANTDSALPPPPPRAPPGTAATLRRRVVAGGKPNLHKRLAPPSQHQSVMVRLYKRAEKNFTRISVCTQTAKQCEEKSNTIHEGTKQTPGKIKNRVKTPATRPPMATARPLTHHTQTPA